MPDAKSIQDLAQELYDRLETRKRDSGETFVTLTDDAPEWMTEVVHAAHGHFLPDDYRYAWIRDAAEHIAQSTDLDADDLMDEGMWSWADESVDIYNSDLLRWVSSNLNRISYCDEGSEGCEDRSLMAMVMQGQAMERRETYGALVEALTALSEASEEGES